MKAIVAVFAMLVLANVRADESFNDYLRQTLENLKALMPTGNPAIGIPVLEPLSIPKIDEHIRDGAADVKIIVDKLKIAGLSKFDIRHVDGNLQNLQLSINLFFPKIAAEAEYDLNGKIFNFIPLYGKGPAHIQIVDLDIKGTAGLTMVNGHFQSTPFQLELSFGSISVHLENILGGGSLGDVVNGVVNMLGKILFDKFKPDILRELNSAVLKELNDALSKVSIEDIMGGLGKRSVAKRQSGNANQFVDQILTNARPSIEKDLDPIKLPDARESFSKKILFVTVHGSVAVYNGLMAGLKTLHRTGDATLTQNADGSITVSAKLGVDNLAGQYRAHAKFMNLGPTVTAYIKVRRVSVRFSVKQSFSQGAHPELIDFAIERVDGLSANISGLGPLDWILNLLTKLVLKLAKDAIVKAIQSPIRDVIRNELKNINIPIGK